MKTKLIDKVDDGFNYFLGYRLEELKEDDVYYIKGFMDYIESLEIKTTTLTKKLKEYENTNI
tara:strand:- start:27 stop:212 length:186 start_codon:yes stop_codon:yes gene_type:complete